MADNLPLATFSAAKSDVVTWRSMCGRAGMPGHIGNN
jgi:hypothetical protein